MGNFEIENRIKSIRNAAGLNQEEFGRRLGVSKGVIVNIELHRNKKPIIDDEPFLDLICTIYNINKNWLLTGEGDVFNPMTDNELFALQKRYNLSDTGVKILRHFFSLSDEEQDDFIALMSKVFNLEDKNTENKTNIKLVSSNNTDDDKDDYHILAADTATDKPIIIHTDEE